MSLRRPLAWVGRTCLASVGWRAVGEAPKEAKYVLIAAPHTSNWDFPLMMLCGMAMGVWPCWVGKASLFRPPLGWMMRLLRGIPVERSSANNMVELLAAEFASRAKLAIAMPPEGTRARALHWKSGFYHVARAARVPIALGYLDYARKEGGIGAPIAPGNDLRADMDRIRAFYAGKAGCHPELQGPVRLSAEDQPPSGTDGTAR